MIKAIIFDNFGVLYKNSAALAYERLAGDDRSKWEEYIGIFRANDLGLITKAEWDQQIADLFGITAEEWDTTITSLDGKNIALLDQVVELRKNYKTALLSNLGPGRIDDYYTAEEQAKYFDVVVGSGDLGIAKPDAQIYEYTAKQLGLQPEECVFTDDSMVNVDGAKEAGMEALYFDDTPTFLKELKVLLET